MLIKTTLKLLTLNYLIYIFDGQKAASVIMHQYCIFSSFSQLMCLNHGTYMY